jgi:hypothetical protein
LYGEDDGHVERSEFDWVHGEVLGLKTVGEGYPDQITEGQHEAEAVGCDVDCGEDGLLHVEGVEDVDGLRDYDHD